MQDFLPGSFVETASVAAQLAFTASFMEDTAVVGRAVAGLPGLADDRQHGTFSTWIEAHAYAQKLNEDLGLTPFECRSLVTEVMLAAAELISDCHSLQQESRRLVQNLNEDARLGLVLAELDLGATFCCMACDAAPESTKRLLLRNARKALSGAILSMGRFEFTPQGAAQLRSGMQRLQDALQEYASKDGFSS